MSIKHNGNPVTGIKYNSTDENTNKVILDNTIVWCKPYLYTQGTLPTGVASLTCTRDSTEEPTASTGVVSNNGVIYYNDKIFWSATASAGYTVSVTHGSSSPVTVSSNIIGITSSGVTATRITWSYTINLSNMSKVKYSKDGGTTWTEITSNTTVSGIDYGATLKIQGVTAATGYTADTTTYSRTYSNAGGTITISGTRITWTLTITKSNYMATVTYTKNSEAAVAVSSSTTLTLDYADSVVVSGTKQSEAPYNYGNITGAGTFTYSSPSTGNKTTTVACTRSVKSYTFTLTKNSNVSSIKVWRTSSPYQGAATSTESSPLINGTGTATVYYGDVLAGTASAVTGYHFDSSNSTTTKSYSNSGVTSTPSWSPTVNLNAYTASFTATNCSWESSSKTIYHFDYISTSGQTVTCKAGGSSGTTRWTNTATKGSETGYSFSTPTLSGNTSVSSVTGNISVAASSTKTRLSYTITLAKDASNNFFDWKNGSTIITEITAYYGDVISVSGNIIDGHIVTCKKWDAPSTNRWQVVPTAYAETVQYRYSNPTVSPTAEYTVAAEATYTGYCSRFIQTYPVMITAGSGISSVYTSTNSTATSGNGSGYLYNYNSTVYAFAVLAEHYDIPEGSNWVLISGTANATGAKYRVGSVSNLAAPHNFGTINAAIEKYTLAVTKGTGVSTIYYKVNGASSYSNTTSNLSVSVNDLSTYYYYATASSYYGVNSDCGTSSSPKSGTVNCANISTSVSATAKQYTLVGTYTNGSVTWYSDSARTTAITKAAYGSTVYYAYSANTGYTGSGNGSLVLNTTNFTFASTDANANATHNFGSATRITWRPTVTLGTGVTNFVYSLDGGTTWSSAVSSWPSNVNVDYADNVRIKVNAVNDYYVLDSTTVYVLIYASPTYTLTAQPKTYSLQAPDGVETLYGPGPGSGGIYIFYNAPVGGSTITSAQYNTTVYLQFIPSTSAEWKSMSTPSSRYTIQVTTANFSINNSTQTATYKTTYQTRKSATINLGTPRFAPTIPATVIPNVTTVQFSIGTFLKENTTYPVTIYYGQKLYFTAALGSGSDAINYNRVYLAYPSTSDYYTWAGSDGATLTAYNLSYAWPGHSFEKQETNCTIGVTRTKNGRTGSTASEVVTTDTILFDYDELQIQGTKPNNVYGAWSYEENQVTAPNVYISTPNRTTSKIFFSDPNANSSVNGGIPISFKNFKATVVRQTRSTITAAWSSTTLTSNLSLYSSTISPVSQYWPHPAPSSEPPPNQESPAGSFTLNSTQVAWQADATSLARPAVWNISAEATPEQSRISTVYTWRYGYPKFTSGVSDGVVGGAQVVKAAGIVDVTSSLNTNTVYKTVSVTPTNLSNYGTQTMTMTAGTGITRIWFGNSYQAAPGTTSSTTSLSVAYGTSSNFTDVYGCVELDYDYKVPDSWYLSYGTRNTKGSRYCVLRHYYQASSAYGTTFDFGTINAIKKPYKISLNLTDPGADISTILFAVNGVSRSFSAGEGETVLGYVDSTDTYSIYVTTSYRTTYLSADAGLSVVKRYEYAATGAPSEQHIVVENATTTSNRSYNLSASHGGTPLKALFSVNCSDANYTWYLDEFITNSTEDMQDTYFNVRNSNNIVIGQQYCYVRVQVNSSTQRIIISFQKTSTTGTTITYGGGTFPFWIQDQSGEDGIANILVYGQSSASATSASSKYLYRYGVTGTGTVVHGPYYGPVIFKIVLASGDVISSIA